MKSSPRMGQIAFACALGVLLLTTAAPRAQEGPGRKILRYGILDYGKGKRKGRTTITRRPTSKVYFAPRYRTGDADKLFIRVKRIYNSVHYTSVANAGTAPVRVTVRVRAPAGVLMGVNGTGGEEPVTIPPRSHASLPIKIFAQDARPGLHDFGLELLDASGKVIDSREGRLYVQRPEVKLALVPLPAKGSSDGLRKTFELKNLGDELTDVSLELEDLPGYAMNPRVDHYLLGKGKSVRLEIFPTDAGGSRSGQVLVRAAGQTLRFPISMRLPAGRMLQMISLDPIVRLRRKDYYCTNRPIIHLNFNVPYLQQVPIPNPKFAPLLSELKQKGRAFDTDRDGRPDHWQLVRRGRVVAKGDDYDGNGTIDFYRMSDSPERTLNRGYFNRNGRWFETNLVDAFMVSSFVPMSDAAKVKAHDVDVLLNKKLISRRKKIVPAGSRMTRLRVDMFSPNRKGFSRNTVTVSTKHLPGHHYQVTAQNTLVLHFSTIQIPMLVKKPVKLDTTAIDKTIRDLEAKLAATVNEAEKSLYRNQIKKNREYRDKLLKQAAKKVRKAVALRGVQHEGLDLGVYASDMRIGRGRLLGFVRNQAYLSSGYRLSLYRVLPGGKKRRIAMRRYPALPPFGRRAFALRVPGHSSRRRYLYRLELKALSARKELALSNNVAHVVTGPPPTVNGLRGEMRYLAQELGVNQDQLTLVRPAPVFRVNQGIRPYTYETTIRDVTLSTPTGFRDAMKSPRTFLFQER